MACTTTRDTTGTVLGITCTRGPAPARDAAAMLAHFAEHGLITEDAPTQPAPVALTPALFDLTDDDPETCTCGGCDRCGGCLVPMDADLLPCEPWTCFCDLV